MTHYAGRHEGIPMVAELTAAEMVEAGLSDRAGGLAVPASPTPGPFHGWDHLGLHAVQLVGPPAVTLALAFHRGVADRRADHEGCS